MAKTKIALLYELLSHDNKLQGESFSIQDQKTMLENYAQRNGFPRFQHFTDDGVSGTHFNRARLYGDDGRQVVSPSAENRRCRPRPVGQHDAGDGEGGWDH